MTTIIATPAKLSDGTWGARVPGVPSIGAAIEIRTAAGKSWVARVIRVVVRAASPGESSLVATQAEAGRGASENALADRGLVRVASRRGCYVRRMNARDRFDEYDA